MAKKRRANGEGSIYPHTKDKNGKATLWAASYTDNAGKRRTLYGKTQQIVKDKLKEAIRQSDRGMQIDKGKILFSDWIYEWLEVYIKPTTKLKTYGRYYLEIENHITPAFQNVLLKDVRADMLQEFFNEKAIGGRIDGKDGGFSLSVLRSFKKVISGALKQAVENNMIAVDVSAKVKLPRVEVNDKRILTRCEQERLEKEVSECNNPLSFAILLSLYTCLRIGELLALKIEDVDFNKKELHVRRTIGRVYMPNMRKTIRLITDPKTKKSNRIIPLPDFIVKMLKQYTIDREAIIEAMKGRWIGMEKEKADKWKDEGYVFVTLYGTIPDTATMDYLLHRLLEKAEIKHMGYHALRHTFATRCLEAGFDVKSLADILGHADVKMTLNIYTHALPGQKHSNMNKLTPMIKHDVIV